MSFLALGHILCIFHASDLGTAYQSRLTSMVDDRMFRIVQWLGANFRLQEWEGRIFIVFCPYIKPELPDSSQFRTSPTTTSLVCFAKTKTNPKRRRKKKSFHPCSEYYLHSTQNCLLWPETNSFLLKVPKIGARCQDTVVQKFHKTHRQF